MLSHTLKLKYWLCLGSVLVEPSAVFWDVWVQTLLLIQKSQALVCRCFGKYGYQFIELLKFAKVQTNQEKVTLKGEIWIQIH